MGFLSMKVYLWFRSPSRAAVDRCAELFNKLAAADFGEPYPVRARLRYNEDLQPEETDPPLYGYPLDAGSEAGNNLGAALFHSARLSIDGSALLTQAERDELLMFVAQAEDVDANWWADPDSPDYGPLTNPPTCTP